MEIRRHWARDLLGICVLLSTVVGCAARSGQGSGASALASKATLALIPVGEGPTLLALSADGSRVYAAANSQLSVISTANDRVVATITTQPYPTGLAVDPSGARAFLSALFSLQLMVVDTRTTAVTTPIELFAAFNRGGFGRIALSPEGGTAYIANTRNEVLAVVDTTRPETTSLPMDMRPVDIAVAPDGRSVYVAGCKNFCVTGAIEVLDAGSQLVKRTLSVGSKPYRIALSPDGTRAYTANLGSPSLSVVDLASGSVTATVAVPAQPTGLAVSSDGQRIYVASQATGTIT